MDTILDFLCTYMSHAIHAKNGIEILYDVLEGFFLLEGYSTLSIQNMQRYVLHGVLRHFQERFLFDSAKQKMLPIPVHMKNWDVQFARFCVCAMDHIMQWFKLPSHTPTVQPTMEQILIEREQAEAANNIDNIASSHESTAPDRADFITKGLKGSEPGNNEWRYTIRPCYHSLIVQPCVHKSFGHQ